MLLEALEAERGGARCCSCGGSVETDLATAKLARAKFVSIRFGLARVGKVKS